MSKLFENFVKLFLQLVFYLYLNHFWQLVSVILEEQASNIQFFNMFYKPNIYQQIRFVRSNTQLW